MSSLTTTLSSSRILALQTRRIPQGRDYYRLMTTLKLPIKWMALESMEEKIFSPQSDCWGFGVVCWEILRSVRSRGPCVPS